MIAKTLRLSLVTQSLLCVAFTFSTAVADEASKGASPSAAAAEIDRLLTEEVFAQLPSGESLAPVTSDQAFLRRVYFDLVGEPPLPGEITAFCLDSSADKRLETIERLLGDERFGRNWARYWRDVIVYRRSADQALFVLQSLEGYLAEQFNKEPHWNQIARSFVTAEGEVAEKGETGLFMAHLADPVEVASEVSRIFMGIQIQCAQCHDHPTDRWKRNQFHEFAAFFPRASLRRRQGMPPSFAIASRDFGPPMRRPGMQVGQGSLEHFMPDLKDPASQGTAMTPVFFATGKRLSTGVTDSERRGSISEWMTSADNPWFARAFVNRIWAELVGEGFYEPIDDIGPDRQASAPQTLDYLCQQFVEHNYDVKWLMEAIVASQAYQRESQPKRLPEQVPFTANVAYRLRADQLFDALSLAIGQAYEPAASAGRYGPGFRGGPRFGFAQQFGYDPSVRRDEIASTIPQALMMMNSGLVNQRYSARQPESVLAKTLANTADDDAVAEELYLRCLAREPSEAELAVCREHVRTSGNRGDAFEDIFWTLINSEEFLYRN